MSPTRSRTHLRSIGGTAHRHRPVPLLVSAASAASTTFTSTACSTASLPPAPPAPRWAARPSIRLVPRPDFRPLDPAEKPVSFPESPSDSPSTNRADHPSSGAERGQR